MIVRVVLLAAFCRGGATSVDRTAYPRLRPGSAELLRLELANWLLGAAAVQVLMAETTAADAGVDPARITRAAGRLPSGASCDRDDHTSEVTGVAFSADGLLATASNDKTARLWN